MAEEGAIPSRPVLIPMDQSDSAKQALKYYLDHLQRTEDFVILQHVPENKSLRHATALLSMEPYHVGDLVRQERTRALAFVEELQLMLHRSGKSGRVELSRGFRVGQEICRLVKSSHSRMVVMAARGMGLHRRTSVGSVAHYVLHHARVPVVVFSCQHMLQHGRR